MEASYATVLLELGSSLAALAVKGTASAINSKVKLIKDERNLERVKSSYDEIINELINEREEAVRIAQAYRAEIERFQISDDDIRHLHNTVERILEIVRVMSPDTPLEAFEQMKELISIDTLKAIQLLGFNYKAAIGEPLTKICAEAILSKSKSVSYPTKARR
jgi:hypothetical protein